jgi:methionine-rich copper-binding protein CopC
MALDPSRDTVIDTGDEPQGYPHRARHADAIFRALIEGVQLMKIFSLPKRLRRDRDQLYRNELQAHQTSRFSRLRLLALESLETRYAPAGLALQLDGVDDYATAIDNASLDLGIGATEDFTVEASFYLAGPPVGDKMLVYKQNAYALFFNENGTFFRIWTGPASNSFFTLQTSVSPGMGWHHIAGVFDNEFTATSDLLSLYFDGAQIGSTTGVEVSPGINNSTSALNVGAFAAVNGFSSWIEEVRLSSSLRYSGAYTIPSLPFVSDANTRGLWHFDEVAGSTVFVDASANTNTLTGVNGAKTGIPLGTVLTVTSLADSGSGTIREAITLANGLPGRDEIRFNIPGTGPHTINLFSALPNITDPIIIDGTSEPGFAGTPIIELSGANAAPGTNGLRISAGCSIVRGLVINRFAGYGILLETRGANRIEGNYIGTDANGILDLGNASSGLFVDRSSGNMIGGQTAAQRNVISGNDRFGIEISGTFAARVASTIIQGNLIGTNAIGNAALGNTRAGISATNSDGGLIGGTAVGSRNVVSANTEKGIDLIGSHQWVIQGNYVGTNAEGTLFLGTQRTGISLAFSSSCNDTRIGGPTAEARNVIVAGNGASGVFSYDGIFVSENSQRTVIQGNYIGLNAAGTATLGVASIGIENRGPNTLIGGTSPEAGNKIAGFTTGISTFGLSNSGTVIQGNFVGTNALGDTARPNSWGINASGMNVTIGGVSPGAGNLISGNSGYGIIAQGTSSVTIQGNRIGTNAAGNTALPNDIGVYLIGTGHVVGGTSSGAGNLISGNIKDGVQIDGSSSGGASGMVLLGNRIGTSATGTTAVPNGQAGVFIKAGPLAGINNSGTLIGGTVLDAGNVISGNAVGVKISGAGATAHTIQGNRIGTTVDGTQPLGNTTHGVWITSSSFGNTVGGTAAGASNLIAHNGADGIFVDSGTTNNLRKNSFFANTDLGIDLGPNGVTLNDTNDSDTGANNQVNFPLLISSESNSRATTIAGTLNSVPNSIFTLDFFSNDTADPSGFGEGKNYLGSTTVTTTGTGDASFTVEFPVSISEGQFITATSTDPAGSTSEFSGVRIVTIEIDTTAPTAISLSPVDNSTGVSLRTNLVITFSETIQMGSGNIVIKRSTDHSVFQTIAVTDAAVTLAGSTVTINPNDFVDNTGYYVELAAGVFKDSAGNDFAGIIGATAWNFTIADTTAPALTSLSPVDNATGVPLSANLAMTFSEAIQKGLGNIFIKRSSDNSVFQTLAATDTAVTISGSTVTINPNDFVDSTGYYVEVAVGAFKDIAGNNFTGISGATAWNFTIADTTAPALTSLSPVDNATGVPLSANLTMTFGEAIQKGSGNIVIRRSSDNSVVQTIAVTDTAVTIAGSTVTINPNDFIDSTGYYIEVAAGAFKDLAGNNFAGVSAATAWNFTSADTKAPTLASHLPANNAIDVPLSSNLVMTFVEAIQKGSGNIVIKRSIDNSVFQIIAVTDASVTVTGLTVTINPNDFVDTTGYYVEVAVGAFKDLAGNNFAGISAATTWNFTTADTTAPTLTSLSPADNAIGVPLSTNLEMTFGEAIQKGSGDIAIKRGTDNSVFQTIAVTDSAVTIAGSTVTINPNDFVDTTGYYIEVAVGAFKDLAGNNFAGISVATAWNFTTADTTAPTVTSISPADNAIGVLLSANLEVTFSEAIQKGSGDIVIKRSTDNSVFQTIAVTDSAVTIAGSTVTINPSDFVDITGYYIEVAAGAIKDLAENNFAGINTATAWNFTTADTTAPTLTSLSPADNAIGVPLSANLEVTFGEAIQKGSGNIVIKRSTDNSVFQTIAVTDTDVTIAGSTVTINPNDFVDITGYYVEVAVGAIRDLAGNNFAGINATTAWNFTTADTTAPTLTSLSPADNAIGVPLSTNLVMTFSEPIQKGSGDIVIKRSTDNSVFQTIAVTDSAVTIADSTVTINPNDFPENTGYYVVVASGVFSDLANNAFAGIDGSNTWNFTTTDVTAPTVTGLLPTRHSTRVSLSSNLTITFNEAIQKGSGLIVIKKSVDNSVFQTITVSDSAVSATGSVVTINPNDFAPNTGYYIEVEGVAFKDLSNNNFPGISGATIWNFTTTTVPSIVDVIDVAPNPRNVAVFNVEVEFDEPIDLTTFTFADVKLARNGVYLALTSAVTTSHVVGGRYRISGLEPYTTQEGVYVLSIVGSGIQDLAGHNCTGAASNDWEMDVTVPTAPVITRISADTGTSATDGITSDTTLVISGTAEASSMVRLTRVGMGIIGTTTANSAGMWNFDYSGTTLPVGSHHFTAIAADLAANISETSNTLGVLVYVSLMNPANRLDVNNDSFVSPVDVLIVISRLNSNRQSGTPTNVLPGPPFVDVNDDRVVTPLDALLVIAYLNSPRAAGEGESSRKPAFEAFSPASIVTALQSPAVSPGLSSRVDEALPACEPFVKPSGSRDGRQAKSQGLAQPGPQPQLFGGATKSNLKKPRDEMQWISNVDDDLLDLLVSERLMASSELAKS